MATSASEQSVGRSYFRRLTNEAGSPCHADHVRAVVRVRVAVGSSSILAVIVYRPGSAVISAAFFVEMSDVSERHATFAELVLMTGDVSFVGALDIVVVAVDDAIGSTVSSLHVEDLANLVTSEYDRFPCCLSVVTILSTR